MPPSRKSPAAGPHPPPGTRNVAGGRRGAPPQASGKARGGEGRVGAVSEASLYAPVKRFLERLGYEVKGEVRGCDLVARRGDEPVVIVELKLRFNLALVLQGIDRLAVSERVYVAVPRQPSSPARRFRGVMPQAS